jgi:hypothetical protein
MAMRKSKKAAEVVSSPNMDSEGFLCIQGTTLWKWRALDAELRALLSEMEQVKARVSAEIAKHQELASLFGIQAGLAGQISVAKGELNSVQSEIESQLGVPLKDCAFDDKTGRLYNLAQDGTRGEPVKPPKKRRVRKSVSVDT